MKKVPTEEQAIALYKSWVELVKLKEKMGRNILEIVEHPDSTPEDVARWMPRYKDVVAKLRAHKPVMLDALSRYHRLHRAVQDMHI
jgi:hypothetical protein